MDLASIKPEWVGGFFAALIVGVIKAVGPAIAKAVTNAFKRKRDEDERMDERAKEIAENEALAPLRAQIIELQADLARANARAAEAQYAADMSAGDLAGLGEDMRRLAADKALAEQERDEALRKAALAESEAEEWRLAAVAAEHRAAAEEAKKREDKVTPKEAKHAERATGEPGRSGDAAGGGGAAAYRPPRPGGAPSPQTVPVPRHPAKRG